MPKHLPQRQCLGCREMMPKQDLVRVVRMPDGELRLDRTGKLSGRGAYLCSKPACFAKAKKSKALERALDTQVPPELYDRLAAELAEKNSEGEKTHG